MLSNAWKSYCIKAVWEVFLILGTSKLRKKLMAPIYAYGLTVSRLLRDSKLFTTKFPGYPRAHMIDLGRMNGWVNPTSGFKSGISGLRIQRPNHKAIFLTYHFNMLWNAGITYLKKK